MGTYASWWKYIGTEVKSFVIILTACLNSILHQCNETGTNVSKMVRTIQVIYGKKRKRDKAPIDGVPFKKQSIFYKYLLYWADLEVRHAIDGMHLKNNVFGNTIGLLLETSAKTKDTLKSRQDLVAMKIRQDLHPVDKGNGRYELPQLATTLHMMRRRQCARA